MRTRPKGYENVFPTIYKIMTGEIQLQIENTEAWFRQLPITFHIVTDSTCQQTKTVVEDLDSILQIAINLAALFPFPCMKKHPYDKVL